MKLPEHRQGGTTTRGTVRLPGLQSSRTRTSNIIVSVSVREDLQQAPELQCVVLNGTGGCSIGLRAVNNCFCSSNQWQVHARLPNRSLNYTRESERSCGTFQIAGSLSSADVQEK